jgi:hypothetical protein
LGFTATADNASSNYLTKVEQNQGLPKISARSTKHAQSKTQTNFFPPATPDLAKGASTSLLTKKDSTIQEVRKTVKVAKFESTTNSLQVSPKKKSQM